MLLTSGGVDIITVSTDGTARVWDMEIGDCVLLLAGHGGPLTDVAASADGALLLTGAADGAEPRVAAIEQLVGRGAKPRRCPVLLVQYLAVAASAGGAHSAPHSCACASILAREHAVQHDMTDK